MVSAIHCSRQFTTKTKFRFKSEILPQLLSGHKLFSISTDSHSTSKHVTQTSHFEASQQIQRKYIESKLIANLIASNTFLLACDFRCSAVSTPTCSLTHLITQEIKPRDNTCQLSLFTTHLPACNTNGAKLSNRRSF